MENLEAGYKKVMIRPMLPKGMDFVEMTLDTVNGRIRLKCERRDGQLVKTVQADDRIEVMETSYENMFYV